MTPAELSCTVLRTVRRAVEAGELRAPVPARAVVRRPPRPGCGDYATNIALQLARHAGRPPQQVAEILRSRIERAPGIARVDIAEPGFLNITLEDGTQSALVRTVLARGEAYGHGDAYAHQVVELSIPYETRAAVTADALARILRAQGAADVTIRCERCEREHDPAWAQLGVGGPGASTVLYGPGPAAVPLRPVPVKATAAELLRTLGPDAARWALLRSAAHDHPCTDPRHLLAQRESNPLFRIQYAHARACALLRNAADLGITPQEGDPGDSRHPGQAGRPGQAGHAGHGYGHRLGGDSSPAGQRGSRRTGDLHPRPAAPLLAALGAYPAVLASAARLRAPDRVARHLEATAEAFFRFHDTCPVLPRGDEKPGAAHRARAALAQAAGTVLAGGLHLLGISAPAHL